METKTHLVAGAGTRGRAAGRGAQAAEGAAQAETLPGQLLSVAEFPHRPGVEAGAEVPRIAGAAALAEARVGLAAVAPSPVHAHVPVPGRVPDRGAATGTRRRVTGCATAQRRHQRISAAHLSRHTITHPQFRSRGSISQRSRVSRHSPSTPFRSRRRRLQTTPARGHRRHHHYRNSSQWRLRRLRAGSHHRRCKEAGGPGDGRRHHLLRRRARRRCRCLHNSSRLSKAMAVAVLGRLEALRCTHREGTDGVGEATILRGGDGEPGRDIGRSAGDRQRKRGE
jgi:hypothetical protein